MSAPYKESPLRTGVKQVLGTFTIAGNAVPEHLSGQAKQFEFIKGNMAQGMSIEQIEKLFAQQSGGGAKVSVTIIQKGPNGTVTKTTSTTKGAQMMKMGGSKQDSTKLWNNENMMADGMNMLNADILSQLNMNAGDGAYTVENYYEGEPFQYNSAYLPESAFRPAKPSQKKKEEQSVKVEPVGEKPGRRAQVAANTSANTAVNQPKPATKVEEKPPKPVQALPEPKVQKTKKVKGQRVKLDRMESFEFSKTQQRLIKGNSKEKGGPNNGPDMALEDCIDGFGLASLFYQNSCYTDGRYNNSDYKVEAGVVGGVKAYKVYPPQKKFNQFLASHHCVAFKLGQKVAHTVYKFENGSLDVVGQIPAETISPQQFSLVKNVTVSQLAAPVVYLCVPSDKAFTPLRQIEKGVFGAVVYADKNIFIQQINFPIGNEIAVPESFSHGPNSHYNCYNPNRDIFKLSQAQDTEAIVWASVDKNNIYLSKIDRTSCEIKTCELECKKGFQLAAATGDDQFVYYMIVQKDEPQSKTATQSMFLVKAKVDTGNTVMKQAVPTDAKNLNIHHFDACQLALSGKRIGMIVSRKMTMGSDGLNHQGAYAAVFDATTLKLTTKHGQTSGHSFAHTLLTRKDGKFMGYDLGDNYPRAVHHWNFDHSDIEYKQVYSFKTEHGTQAKSPAGVSYPVYGQISNGKKKFYKWSNDNRTYTQLAATGVVQQTDGTLIFFAGENYPSALDSSKTGLYNNEARNIGFVKVSKDLRYGEGILSEGKEEKGGFFTFQGSWSEQKNKGINWLTNFSKNDQNVSRLKTAKFGDDVFILYEVWNKDSYLRTEFMIVDGNGKSIVGRTQLPLALKMHKSDDIHWDGQEVIVYVGSKGRTLKRFSIRRNKGEY